MSKVHRHTVHSSYHFEADFLIYHKNGMLVSYVVRGKHLPEQKSLVGYNP